MNASGNHATDTFNDQNLNGLLADALMRMDRDEPVDIDNLISIHPEYAAEIREFFSFSYELSDLVDTHESTGSDVTVFQEAQRSTTALDGQTVASIHDSLAEPSESVPDPVRIGKYEIQRRLGQGSFGRVYLGFDPLARRHVAIKVATAVEGASERQHQSFFHEAESAASLRHKNIVTLYDVQHDDAGGIYLVYEYVPGPTLFHVLEAGDYQRNEAIRWVADIADALHYAHRKKIVHRDVKPSNVLLDETDGQRCPKVLDFGLALLHEQSWQQSEGCRVGAIGYMSPEQAKGDSHWATAQSDVFSLGVILYQVLCRRSPWEGRSGKKTLQEIQSRHPTPPRVVDDTIPRELERICLKAMAKSPADRHTTAADFAQELRAAIDPKAASRRRWLPLAGVAAAAALAIAALGTAMFHTSTQSPVASATPEQAPPAPKTIQPQEVHLELRIQPRDQPGEYVVLSDQVSGIEASDGVQVYTDVKEPGYLYCLWYRPDGTVRLLGEEQLDATRPAIEQPSVGPQLRWTPFGESGIGEHLIIAFTKPTPLTPEECEMVKRASWKTDFNQLGELAMLEFGFPRSASSVDRSTRGAEAAPPTTVIEPDAYLGELGTILKKRWKCYYQGLVFQVHEEGYRSQAF